MEAHRRGRAQPPDVVPAAPNVHAPRSSPSPGAPCARALDCVGGPLPSHGPFRLHTTRARLLAHAARSLQDVLGALLAHMGCSGWPPLVVLALMERACMALRSAGLQDPKRCPNVWCMHAGGAWRAARVRCGQGRAAGAAAAGESAERVRSRERSSGHCSATAAAVAAGRAACRRGCHEPGGRGGLGAHLQPFYSSLSCGGTAVAIMLHCAVATASRTFIWVLSV